MKQVNWRIKEDFVFPVEIGEPTSAENIQITPRFTAETVEGRPKLTGIYHLAVTVNLTGEKAENYDLGDAIVIEDLDLNENSGYFEYALPFNIDFPPEAENPVDIETLNPTFEVDGHQLAILWDVSCTYAEAGIQKQNEGVEEKKETANKKVAQKEHAGKETHVQEQKNVESVEEVYGTEASLEKKETEALVEVSEAQEAPEQEDLVEKTAAQPKKEATTSKKADVLVEKSIAANDDEVLNFIGELEDGISATSFRLNDVLV